MKQRLEVLQHQSLRPQLEDTERQAMRESLIAYMNNHPVRESAAMPQKQSWWYFWNHSTIPFLLLLIIIVAGGILYAANQSLPGTPLYTVRQDVNVPVRNFFVRMTSAESHTSPQSVAQ